MFILRWWSLATKEITDSATVKFTFAGVGGIRSSIRWYSRCLVKTTIVGDPPRIHSCSSKISGPDHLSVCVLIQLSLDPAPFPRRSPLPDRLLVDQNPSYRLLSGCHSNGRAKNQSQCQMSDLLNRASGDACRPYAGSLARPHLRFYDGAPFRAN